MPLKQRPMPYDLEAQHRAYLKEHSDQDPNSPEILTVKNKLADTLINQLKCTEAETLLRDIMPSVREQFGFYAPQSIGCYRDLIRSVECQVRHDEAEQMIKEARQMINGMKKTQFTKHQRVETQLLDRVEDGIKGKQADVEERYQFMVRTPGLGKK